MRGEALEVVGVVSWGTSRAEQSRSRAALPVRGRIRASGETPIDVSGRASLFPRLFPRLSPRRWEHTSALDAELARVFELPQKLPALDHQIAPRGSRR